jgi:hypothetical protein
MGMGMATGMQRQERRWAGMGRQQRQRSTAAPCLDLVSQALQLFDLFLEI